MEKYIDLQQLGHQIEMLKNLSPHCTKTMEHVQRLRDISLLPELKKFPYYLLVTPVTPATAERSSSMLRMPKSYLRTTLTRKRANSLCILHVYSKLTDDLNIEKLISEFINKNEYR
ncbi:hypothetical protein PR048_031271, partial [Dryococelus australis]